MHPKAFYKRDERARDTYDSLREEYDCIKRDMTRIKEMQISEEARILPLEELQKQINEVKERMHDYIDTL